MCLSLKKDLTKELNQIKKDIGKWLNKIRSVGILIRLCKQKTKKNYNMNILVFRRGSLGWTSFLFKYLVKIIGNIVYIVEIFIKKWYNVIKCANDLKDDK